ncbi:MAG: sulfatase-like hydrolase/transferase [Breznakibacter sp.]|nr:sulfatase-like hydrolase/transferase [Breznakibacter sp.]
MKLSNQFSLVGNSLWRIPLLASSFFAYGSSAVAGEPSVDPPKQAGSTAKPNIILILTDQQTASAMGCAGNADVKTPAMDALAKDGRIFERAYCSYPLSGPCRASLMTGKMPVELGVKDNDDPLSDADMARNIGFVLQSGGYDCLYAGKWHIPETDIPVGRGFTKICGMDDRILVDACRPYLATDRQKPLFLVASFLNPHEICEYARNESLHYGALPDVDPKGCPNLPINFMESTYWPEALTLHKNTVVKSYPTGSYSQDDWRRYLYAYYRLVERVDAEMGRLIEVLKSEGLYDNSLIIFTSDHGDGAATHQWNQKRSLSETVVNVPFIVKTPKNMGKHPKETSQALINIGLDVFPTICDYAGVGLPDGLNGHSLRPLMEGVVDQVAGEVFVETLLDGANVRGWSIVEQDYKYVFYRFYKNREQLFSLVKDPGEMLNLAVDQREHQNLVRMREKMYRWAVKTNDLMLQKALRELVSR